MTHARIKLLVGGLVLAGAISLLAYAGMQKGWVYTLGVDHYLAGKQQYASQRVRLCGKVDDKASIGRTPLVTDFVLVGIAERIPVRYKGVLPEMFKPGCELLVEGKIDAAGVFQSDLMMTKCASKYDEAPDGHPVHRPAATQEKADAAKGTL